MKWVSGFDRPVLYVPDNHEFYGSSMTGTVSQFKALCAGTQIQVLDCDEIILQGVRFLGATLWTDFLLQGEGEPRTLAMQEAQGLIRDFKKIHRDEAPGSLFTPEDCAALCQAHATWLECRLAEPHAGPTVVITHHAPSRQSIHPRFTGSLLVKGTRVVCNPRGYLASCNQSRSV